MKNKIIASLICLAAITVLNFALPRLMPGDTVLMLVGMDEKAVSSEQYAMYAEKTGANLPIAKQFLNYIGGIFTGDLGYSYHHRAPVAELIAERLPNTLSITLPAIVFSSLIAVLAGCFAGIRKGSPADSAITAVNIVSDAFPPFLVGLILIAVFSFGLGILPSGALNSAYVPPGGMAADRIRHLVLPILTLVIAVTPSKYLMVRNTVASQRNEKYVLYTRSRGYGRFRTALCCIFPNTFQPFAASVGLSVGSAFSGSLVIENVFSIKGMGTLLSSAITARDYPVLQGVLFVCAVCVTAIAVITDWLCVIFDPKVRLGVYDAQ